MQVSGGGQDDHFRRFVPAEGPSAPPPNVQYNPIGGLNYRRPHREESGSTVGSRGRSDSPRVSPEKVRLFKNEIIKNVDIVPQKLELDYKGFDQFFVLKNLR